MTSSNNCRRVRSYWQAHILAEIGLLRAEIESESGEDGEKARDAVKKFLDEAEDAACFARMNPFERLRSRVFGGAVESAYANLHAARVLWARNCPARVVDLRMGRARARLLAIAEPTDRRAQVHGELLEELSRRPEEERETAESSETPDEKQGLHEKRETLAAALEWIYSASDSQHARVRNFRNVVWMGVAALTAFVVALGLLGAMQPEAIRLCFDGDAGRQVCPTGSSPTSRDTAIIELLGLLGGAVSAIVTIRRLEGRAVSFSVPLSLAVLKLPVGAVSALSGLLLIHGRFIPGLTNLDTEGQILAYAIVLGAAQQLVTRLVDRVGSDVLARVPDNRVETGATSGAPLEHRQSDLLPTTRRRLRG